MAHGRMGPSSYSVSLTSEVPWSVTLCSVATWLAPLCSETTWLAPLCSVAMDGAPPCFGIELWSAATAELCFGAAVVATSWCACSVALRWEASVTGAFSTLSEGQDINCEGEGQEKHGRWHNAVSPDRYACCLCCPWHSNACICCAVKGTRENTSGPQDAEK